MLVGNFYFWPLKLLKLSLIKSISGIRGTIGGLPEQNLSPIDVVRFAAAFGQWVIKTGKARKAVIGRDARISGPMVSQLVSQTLVGLGFEVIDLGLSTTPTVEIAVPLEAAGCGIILTASHNPKQWNALKLLNEKGEFISGAEGAEVLRIAESGEIHFAEVDKLGCVIQKDGYLEKHIDMILAHPLVNVEAIRARGFRIAVDAVNSGGGVAVPLLLKKLGVENQTLLYCEPNGHFPHNPEPLPEHLYDLSVAVKKNSCDLGISVDPDVDRLALVCEDGSMFGEEYTLVAVADYILQHRKGAAVSNLSSTRALKDVALRHGVDYFASAVGEVNVVEKMKAENAVIGGEGNGGIIVPDLHYGRDALAGIALFLSWLALSGKSATQLLATYPRYVMSKKKAELEAGTDVDGILEKVSAKYSRQPQNTEDGLKIEFDKDWVHLRRSNTEPIIRIYSESHSQTTADHIAQQIMQDIAAFRKS